MTEQEILQERARALARPLEDGSASAHAREVMRWERGAQRFAVELLAVRAIAPADRLAAVPHAPPALLGMAAFRGGLLPVYDPRHLLAADAPQSANVLWAIVIDDGAPFGLAADALPEIEILDNAELQPAAADLPAQARDCVVGVDRSGRVLLEPGALGTDPGLTSAPDHHDRS